MLDKEKPKQQLINELAELRQRVCELEKSEKGSRADEALQVSETRYRRLFETAQDGILLLDADTGKITDVNPFLIDMLGYSHEELLGKKLWDIGLFKDIVASKAAFLELQTKGYVRYEDLPFETKDGRSINVEFVSNVYLVDHTKIIQCNIRDISERRLAENASLKARKYAESIMETIRQPFVVLNKDLMILSANCSFYSTFKVTPGETEGNLIYDIGDRQWDIPSLRTLLEEILPKKKEFINYEVSHKFQTIGQKIMILNARQIYQKVVGIPMILLAIEDITERRKMEIELVAAAERKRTEDAHSLLASIVEFSDDAIFSKTLDGIILSWNPGAEKLYGYSADEIIGKPISIFIPQSYSKEMPTILEKINRGETIDHFDAVDVRKDGTQIQVSIKVSSLKNIAGRIIGAATIARDITESNRTEEELRKANRALKALSNCEQAVIHAENELQLLEEVCRIIVDVGGYRMAWVGIAEHDENKTVRPLTFAGVEDGYIETLKTTWADTERGRGPTGTAIRTGKPSFCRNILTDPAFAPWRDEARKHGYGSSGVFPLIENGRTFGAVSIYACESDAFDVEEINLLTALADELSFGISALREREERRKNEDILHGSLSLSEYAFSHSLDELITKTLDEAEVLTGSKIGFFHFLEKDQRTLMLQNWSTNTLLNMCTAEGKGEHYPIDEAGVWVDAVRQRHPVIHNDYASLTHKKGLPPGHAPVIREMVIPIMRGELVKGILGVGNKPAEYDAKDIEIASRLANLAWDIVAAKRAEEEVHEASIYNRSLIEVSIDPLITISSEGMITDVNNATELVTGSSREKLIGSDFSDYFTEPKKAREGYTQVFEKGYVRDYPLAIRHTSGRITDVVYNASVFKDAAGNVAGVFAAARDVSARKRAEEALEESEKRYRSLVVATAQIVWTTNAMGMVEDIPAWRAFTGQSEQEIKGWGWSDAVHPDDRERTTASWKRAIDTRSLYGTEFRLRKHDGEYRYFAARGVPVLEKDGTIHEWVGTCTDITERKLAEEEIKHYAAELERSNKELQQFAYIASHDLQEPLRMISSYLQLIERRYKSQLDRDADEFIHFAVDGADRLQKMINGLLAYSRVGTKSKPFEPTDCNKVFDETLANLKVAIKESSAVITSVPLPTVVCDASQLIQVFQNLISNAIKFRGSEPPKIHISAERKEREWQFSVRDNGIGIDPKYHDRLFVVFKRLHGREYEGSGIGLAVCKRIVERHGGRIWVESQAGKGSSFYFTIRDGEK